MSRALNKHKFNLLPTKTVSMIFSQPLHSCYTPQVKTQPIKLAPSLLAADFTKLGQEIKEAEDGGADLLHIDVMDGAFVPNISFGSIVVDACKKASTLFRDVHLMIEKPERYIDDFAQAGAQNITMHAEATPHAHRVLMQIKEHGLQCGLAVNPLTPLEVIREALPFVDLVLIMTINPGFGGQKFIPESLTRIARVKQWQAEGNYSFDIQVDGGIADSTIRDVVKAGANNLVAGSAIFKSNDTIANRIHHLRSLADPVH